MKIVYNDIEKSIEIKDGQKTHIWQQLSNNEQW